MRREDQLKLYRQYYGSFIYSDEITQTEIVTTKDTFGPVDAIIISAMANMIQENMDRVSGGNPNPISIERAAFMDLAEKLGIHVEISSPGKFQIYGKSIAPLILKAFFAAALLGSTVDLFSHAQDAQIEILNSLGPNDVETNRAVQEGMLNLLLLIGAENIERTVELVNAFNARTGGNVDARVLR